MSIGSEGFRESGLSRMDERELDVPCEHAELSLHWTFATRLPLICETTCSTPYNTARLCRSSCVRRQLLALYAKVRLSAHGISACEAIREKAVKILTKEEIEGMRYVCRVCIWEIAGCFSTCIVGSRGFGLDRIPHQTRNHHR